MKKKLLFFMNSLHGGGAEKVLQTLLANLESSKYDITLYSVNEDTLDDKYPKNINYRYIFKQKSSNPLSRLWVKISNKIKLTIYYKGSPKLFYRLFVKGKYDTEVAFIEGYSTRIVSGSTNKKSKKIAWVHIDLKNNHWTNIAYKSLEEEGSSYKIFDSIVCVSKNVKDSMNVLFPNINSFIVRYNPIDDAKIRENTKLESLKTGGPIKIVSSGRLVAQKGYDRLLPIIKHLIDEGLNITLTILGEGPDRDKLEKYILENNLTKVVALPGFVDNPYSIIAHHDLFVCSSRSEGYSTVVTEALILGLPVVTTNCSGMKELLGVNNEFGIVTENNNEALYCGMSEIIRDKNLLIDYSKKAKNRGKKFSLQHLMQQIEEIL